MADATADLRKSIRLQSRQSAMKQALEQLASKLSWNVM